jgi:hypothetical protein
LVQKPYLEMGPQVSRAFQVKFETDDFPVEDNIMMEKISNSVVYKKYVRVDHLSESFKKKFESTIT